MATNTKVKKLRADLGAITTRLRSLAKAHVEARKTLAGGQAELYLLSYQWVNATVGDKPENVTAVIHRMAKMLEVTQDMAVDWYYSGRFMREHGIDYRRAKSGAIKRLQKYQYQLTDAEFRRALDEVRAGKGVFAVVKVVSKSTRVAEEQANRKAEKWARMKILTPKMLKLETMALCTLASKVYGKPCVVKIFDESGKEVLSAS